VTGIPEISLPEALVVFCVIVALFILSSRLHVLDLKGNICSVVIGAVIGLYGGILWLVILLFFVVIGFMGTKFRYRRKEELGVAEKRGGKRGWYNVLANGLVPTFIAFLSPEFGTAGIVMFVTALAVATSDTLASEIGVLSDRVYLITNPFKRIERGIDGGVSLLGQGAALLGAFLISFVAILLIPVSHPGFERNASHFLLPLVLGFTGCQIDSLLGATLEQRGYLGKGGVNFVSIALGSLLAGLAVWCL